MLSADLVDTKLMRLDASYMEKESRHQLAETLSKAADEIDMSRRDLFSCKQAFAASKSCIEALSKGVGELRAEIAELSKARDEARLVARTLAKPEYNYEKKFAHEIVDSWPVAEEKQGC